MRRVTLRPVHTMQNCLGCASLTVFMGLATCLASLESDAAAPRPGAQLNTLFFSPAQRLQLVRERNAAAVSGPTQHIQVNGIVKRAHGKSTVWLNQQALNEGDTDASIRITLLDAQNITLNGQRLRVGESMELLSGTRRDVLPNGTTAARTAQ